MKKTLKLCILILLSYYNVCFAQSREDTERGKENLTFIDTRDNQMYDYILLGNQYWMTENLNYNCEGSFDFSQVTSDVPDKGRLYNINAAQTACPEGWHLPSNAEWQKLAAYISKKYGPFKYLDGDWYGVGDLLKYTDYWNEKGKSQIGFNAVPTGLLRFTKEGQLKYQMTNTAAYWWTSSKVNSNFNWVRSLLKSADRLSLDPGHFMDAYSVRCVKNRSNIIN